MDIINTRVGIVKDRNCWHRFEDWFYYANHSLFEYHANQFIKASQNTKKVALYIRRVLFLGVLANLVICFVNHKQEMLTNKLSEFSIWGLYLTFITLFAGSLINNQDIDMVEDLNYIDNDYLRKKYTPFRAWKWYVLLF